MTTNFCASFAEGQLPSRPPFFNGSNYIFWKIRMKIFIQSLNYELWRIIVNGHKIPSKTIQGRILPKEEYEWDNNDLRNIQMNAKAMNLLFCALDFNEFKIISTCESAKEIWDKLEIIHEGTNHVKESKISMLIHDYELFKMKSHESISEMFYRFTSIINVLKSLGKIYTNTEMVRKILRSLPKSWEIKVIAISEVNDLSKLSLDELIGSLLTHELIKKEGDKEEDNKRKKEITFKTIATCEEEEEDEDNSKFDDEEIAFFRRRFQKFIKNEQRDFIKGEYSKKYFVKGANNKKTKITCYEYNKSNQIKTDCPKIKKQYKKNKKSTMIAAWGDSEESDSKNDDSSNEVANLCLMAFGDDDEVNKEPYSFDELQSAFEELYDEFQKFRIKNIMIKKLLSSLTKENEYLYNKIEILQKE
ncbi:unnamed protein product [Camellia sinensis]